MISTNFVRYAYEFGESLILWNHQFVLVDFVISIQKISLFQLSQLMSALWVPDGMDDNVRISDNRKCSNLSLLLKAISNRSYAYCIATKFFKNSLVIELKSTLFIAFVYLSLMTF